MTQLDINYDWLKRYVILKEVFENNEEYQVSSKTLDLQQSNELHNLLIEKEILGENGLTGKSDIIVAMNVVYYFYIAEYLVKNNCSLEKAYRILLLRISMLYAEYEKELSPIFKANYQRGIDKLKLIIFTYLKSMIESENTNNLNNCKNNTKKLTRHNGIKNRRPGKGHRH